MGLLLIKIPLLGIWANLADEPHNANRVSIDFFDSRDGYKAIRSYYGL
jgi:hypothetical protein